MTKLRATAPSPSVTARDERRLARVDGRDFCLPQAITAAEEAARDLAVLRRMHQVFRIAHSREWFKAEIAKGRR